jgi:hypothetical protein
MDAKRESDIRRLALVAKGNSVGQLDREQIAAFVMSQLFEETGQRIRVTALQIDDALSERKIELYSEYSETGHQGSTEINRTYTLIVNGLGSGAVATLELETDRRSFPDNGDRSVTTRRYQIGGPDLVRLIEQHGKSVP